MMIVDGTEIPRKVESAGADAIAAYLRSRKKKPSPTPKE